MATEISDEFIFNKGMTLGSGSERDSGISDHVLEEEESEEYENRTGLSLDLRFLAGMPELCDVMFLVGEEREPVYAVKAVLAIRSRVFYKMLYGPKSALRAKHRAQQQSTASNMGGAVSRRIQKMFQDNSPVRNSVRGAVSQPNLSNGTHHKVTVVIEEFEPDVFKELLEFIHTGSVLLHPRTLLGLMNAADHFAIEDLRRACATFSHKCIKLETVCSLLVTAERYIQYKSTKIFIQRVLEFVERHGEEVLRLGEVVHLPRHVMELIFSREELVAGELTKYRATERWARHYQLYHTHETLSDLMRPFVKYIHFHQIPTGILIREIQPLAIVPDNLLMTALAFQADPDSVQEGCADSPHLSRLSPRSRGRERMFQLCAASTPNPSRPHHRPPTLHKSHSVDRHTSKCSTGSSGYESMGRYQGEEELSPSPVEGEEEKERCRNSGYPRTSSPRGKTVLVIEPDSPPPSPTHKAHSLSHLSSNSVEFTRM